MGFRESWGPFFGMPSPGKAAGAGKVFNRYERRTTTSLRKAAWDLSRLDRRKFLGMLKEEGAWNKTTPLSHRQIIDMMRKRNEPRSYRKRVQETILTKKLPVGMTDKERERNVRLSTVDRLREEAKSGRQSDFKSGVADAYGQSGKNVSATATRPGATREDRSYDKGNQNKTIYRPI